LKINGELFVENSDLLCNINIVGFSGLSKSSRLGFVMCEPQVNDGGGVFISNDINLALEVKDDFVFFLSDCGSALRAESAFKFFHLDSEFFFEVLDQLSVVVNCVRLKFVGSEKLTFKVRDCLRGKRKIFCPVSDLLSVFFVFTLVVKDHFVEKSLERLHLCVTLAISLVSHLEIKEVKSADLVIGVRVCAPKERGCFGVERVGESVPCRGTDRVTGNLHGVLPGLIIVVVHVPAIWDLRLVFDILADPVFDASFHTIETTNEVTSRYSHTFDVDGNGVVFSDLWVEFVVGHVVSLLLSDRDTVGVKGEVVIGHDFDVD